MPRPTAAPLALLLALLLAACSGAPPAPAAAPSPGPSGRLSVFAAASLGDAFEAIGAAFEAGHPGAEVDFHFAGSQQLVAQINEGAPADVLATASAAHMQAAVAGGRVASGTEQTFALNRLVVVVPKDNPAGIASVQDLAQPGLRLILADAAVPAGQYSLEVLAKASALPAYTESFSPTVLANVVSYEDNVRSVLAKVALGEGDAGIVYTTDAALEAERVALVEIPDELNVIATYPAAPIADSPNPELARAFMAYLLGPEGQAALGRHGFISPDVGGAGAAPGRGL